MKPTRIRNITLVTACGLLALLSGADMASAQVLTSRSFTINSGAGGSGGAQTSCMIMSDGTSWSGGAVGVQGAASTKLGGGSPLAASVTLKYDVGSAVDALNVTYGAGHWTLANPTLTLQYTLYANNTRFGGGAGSFDVYWVGNDGWVQGTRNPIYATDVTTLGTWAGSDALLATENYSWTTAGYTGTTADVTNPSIWTTDKSGSRQATITYGLGLDANFISDITSASSGANPSVSLYLMPTSDTLGLTVFTGGGQSLPTLRFDVVAVPEPSILVLLAGGWVGLVMVRRWRK